MTGLHHPLRAAWRTLSSSSKGRQAVPGMAELLNGLLEDHPGHRDLQRLVRRTPLRRQRL